MDFSGADAAAAPRPDRRRALVGAAFERIAGEGFEGLRTRDVAADAGVNIATLHYYFPTKEALIRGVIGQAMERFGETMPRDGSPVEGLRGHLDAVARLLKTDRQLWAVMGELVLRAPRDPDLGRVMLQTEGMWHEKLRHLIARAGAAGGIAPGLDAADTAALIIAAIRGLSLPSAAGPQPVAVDRVFRQIERLLGLPARGAPTPPPDPG